MGRNKYPEETVAKILDAALELFCAQGYEGTSIQDIVDRLDGMTKGAIYHHFKSKEEIFDASFDRAMAPVVERRRATLGAGNMTGAQKLRRLYAPESVVPQIELWARMHPAADPVKSSRLLALQYQGSFDESAAVSLLANLWLLPLFRPLEPKERMVARAQCLAQMAAAVGLDLGEEVLRTTGQIWDVWNRAGW